MNFFLKKRCKKSKFYALKILTKSSEKFSLLFLKHLFVPCLSSFAANFFIKKKREMPTVIRRFLYSLKGILCRIFYHQTNFYFGKHQKTQLFHVSNRSRKRKKWKEKNSFEDSSTILLTTITTVHKCYWLMKRRKFWKQ